MVQNINKLKGKIKENEYTMRQLASDLGLCELSVRRKISHKNSEFSLSESLKVKEALNLSTQDYLDIFFGSKLELNS